MTLVKFNNGLKNTSANPFFSDVFDSLINDSFLSDKLIARVPAVNVAETENEFHVELAVPGLKKEDFKINLDKNVLSVAAEKKTENVEEGKKFSKREYSYNSFVRSFTLPESADQSKIEADYTDGILKLTVAKREEAKFQTREIAVK
ncbi:Hsp20/alpha crystallin family protein [Mucilaginibacter rubeus]|uniref:Hsp20/alpha crystallin family protein n=1 Tax=Mucilaginibacter rubeus TaxID=2027860 RepID=A0AAE6JEZ6_9SPHI|nr:MULTISPECIES: Hsp20/alpha crystallin family protein [Mucilaginibacter]QEM04073.1 Hsp20/alpha crystallin family protein [Mucilaginibacter rubeus]QEM16676.1 Hsp20/alpha crystallin family protein [Mucilaginibacter gossypii]QTE46848.1 Hsp20/alpha crystallin family protein [Mucilaginibacter rubeus]QTE53446.1 Hsp20/alpha crystallin family protein [Mucilaginibacter rubeus]QTE58532.1 Hsp20/alpha crystallin family protein [Mucilaginibacter rubeus]